MPNVEDLNALLPQTQCGECGYPGCMPYAEALLSGQAAINQCPPGGVTLVYDLAKILQQDPEPFLAQARTQFRPPAVMHIQEPECIGCTKCIQACPVDAIIGTSKHMHAIIPHECTGCGLCVPACPVDCIETRILDKVQYDKRLARQHFEARQVRAQKLIDLKQKTYREKLHTRVDADIDAKKDYIARLMKKSNQAGKSDE